jgi:hypothetical protein
MCPQNMLSDSKFNENQCCESHTLLRDVNLFYKCTFHIYSLFWVKFGTRDLKLMPLSICEFCEKLRREGDAFCAHVNDITFICVPTFFPVSPLQPHCSSIIPSLTEACQHFVITVISS